MVFETLNRVCVCIVSRDVYWYRDVVLAVINTYDRDRVQNRQIEVYLDLNCGGGLTNRMT